MANASPNPILVTDGAFDWSGGVNSDSVTTIESELIPNGLKRNQLAWLNNAVVRGGGILQRTGWQPLVRLIAAGRWQGGFLYEPDSANPYLVCSVSGHIYRLLLEPPYTLTELHNTIVAPWTGYGTNTINGAVVNNPEFNPPDAEMCFFVQGENYLIIQAGDFYTNPIPTLPLIWNGTVLRRSIGITTPAPLKAPSQNEIPAGTCMDYYGNRIWYAGARQYGAGDIVGDRFSGTAGNHYRDSILSVTENPLCFTGDDFTVPTNAGNIRAIKHAGNINASLGQGQLYVFTRKTVYSQTVPVNRTDWINADTNNAPEQKVVQLVNGAVGDRCVVAVNGDLFYQSLEPGIRSLMLAVKNFGEGQWGNTPISHNENRALQFNDRSLMRFASGIEFDNRIWQLALPVLAADGVNVVFRAVLPLDFDVLSTLEETKPPVWEGAYDGLNILQLFSGDFGGVQRGFAVMISDVDGSLNVWELTTSSKTENGDNRVTWSPEFPAFTWSVAGLELKLKELKGGELWVDKLFGTVEIAVYYRVDADPCWRFWTTTQLCAARDCQEFNPDDPLCVAYPYPPPTFREGYRWPIVFPEPKAVCDSMGIRPTTWGYQFQVKVVIKGWCRIRGLLLYAEPREKAQYQGVVCQTPTTNGGMNKLPNPFAAK